MQANGTLKEVLEITDAGDLGKAEPDLAIFRTSTLADSGALEKTGFERLMAIHEHPFGAVYASAGQSRTRTSLVASNTSLASFLVLAHG